MSSISAWLLSIVGIILISVIIEIIMPEGQTNKYIKGVLALFTVFVIVLPLPQLNISQINFNNWFNGGTASQVDENFVESVNEQKLAQYKSIIENTLYENGYLGVTVTVEADTSKSNMTISDVVVDLRLLVLTSEQLNIDKYTKITAIITALINIEEDKIIYYG